MKNKKIILEIIIIPLFISYLFYQLLDTMNDIKILSIIILCLCNLELFIKYIKEVKIYKDKKNIYKVIFIVFNFINLFISFLTIYKNINILYFIICLSITMVYFLISGIQNIIKISKIDNKLYSYTKKSLISLLMFFICLAFLIKII